MVKPQYTGIVGGVGEIHIIIVDGWWDLAPVTGDEVVVCGLVVTAATPVTAAIYGIITSVAALDVSDEAKCTYLVFGVVMTIFASFVGIVPVSYNAGIGPATTVVGVFAVGEVVVATCRDFRNSICNVTVHGI